MKYVFVAAMIALGCCGCAGLDAPRAPADTLANTTANYHYQGDLTAHGGTMCWYYCF
jgi:hypothetical protein